MKPQHHDIPTEFTADASSLESRLRWSRRQFVVTTLAGGFALAAQPAGAQTITTDAAGLLAGEVRITVGDGEIPAYRAMPLQAQAAPLILVVQEIFGVHEHIRDVCRRLAKLGFMAVAPELYARQGDVSKLTDMKEIFAVVERVPDAQVMSDLDATVTWARAHGAHASQLAITGFCWGGRITWLYAVHNPKVMAGVAWYGRLVGQTNTLRPAFPVDVAPALKVPVLGLYGGADSGIPQSSVEQMRAALAKSASGSQIVVYPDMPHAFFADYRPSYRREAAEDGWKRLRGWLDDHGLQHP